MVSSITTFQAQFSNIKTVYGFHTMELALNRGKITKRDADLIKEFIAERKVAANIGASRVNKFIYVLVGWRRFVGPYHELSIADVCTSIDSMKNSLTQKGTPFKQNTKHDWVRILRQFILRMIENQHSAHFTMQSRMIVTTAAGLNATCSP